ncbi:MAG: chemotaxis protein CheA [Gammaproteobacteria bacterium]|nr:chemotaxis protein CheA [Gammaproteobacteria bacterium]
MTIDLADEILQDFLVEAGEILDQLNEQLVDLEQSPDDSDLLNSIFRGFHTIKGGASFLSLTNLVEVCHKAEDVFNLLRNNELNLNADMMDAFLRVLDEVNHMFGQIREGVEPDAAPQELIENLQNMQNPGNAGAESPGEARYPAETVTETGDKPESDAEALSTAADDEIYGEEFEALLGSLRGQTGSPEVDADNEATASDEITDDEFEALLDALHGKNGQADAKPSSSAAQSEVDKKTPETPGGNKITDDEFENLLDQMHGAGKGPTDSQNIKTPQPQASDRPPASRVAENNLADSAAKNNVAVSKPKTAEATVRVDTTRLDDIMNLVGELVLTRNRLNTLKTGFDDERVHQAISNLDMVTGDLQNAVMKTRMQPVKKIFGRFPRVVRDLARSLDKKIELEMVGEDTGLDKNLVEALADPLVHLVRNSVDHGIELPAQREAAGKPRIGKVVLAAKQEGDNILLSIADDGAGMDPEILRAKVVEKGLMDAETASRLDDKGCYDLIFMPGLSTKQNISDVSGRGVGMDVVKTKITQLNGSIDIDSKIGGGTTLNIKVPLTLAILPTLMIQLGPRKFALPLSNISEIFELSSKQISVVDGREVLLSRGKAPPVFHLRKWLLNGGDDQEALPDEPQVIMVWVAHTLVGLVVDQVIGQEEVVIKPLGALLQGLPGLAGSTITGDGNIAILLDVQGLLNQHT